MYKIKKMQLNVRQKFGLFLLTYYKVKANVSIPLHLHRHRSEKCLYITKKKKKFMHQIKFLSQNVLKEKKSHIFFLYD